jgi:hypothetical protein
MDDPFQSQMMMHWDTNDYMHFYLPMLANGYLSTVEGIRWFMKQSNYVDRWTSSSLRSELLACAAETLGQATAEDMMYLYKPGRLATINYDFSYRDSDLVAGLVHGLTVRAWMRYRLLRVSRSRERRQLVHLLKDASGAVLLRVLPRSLLTRMNLLPPVGERSSAMRGDHESSTTEVRVVRKSRRERV